VCVSVLEVLESIEGLVGARGWGGGAEVERKQSGEGEASPGSRRETGGKPLCQA